MYELKCSVPKFASIIAAFMTQAILFDASDKVRELRMQALKQLQDRLAYYESLGYMDQLLCAIAHKKAKMIMNVTTKTEMSKVMSTRVPAFDGNKFLSDQYNIPEEEMILWAEMSLQAPLNRAGFERYKELFEMIFPDQALEVFGDG